MKEFEVTARIVKRGRGYGLQFAKADLEAHGIAPGDRVVIRVPTRHKSRRR